MNKNHLNQEELASRLGLTQAAISTWHSRKTVPGYKVLEKLGEVFNVEPHYFLMKPGTQGQIRSTEKRDEFSEFIDELAKKNLEDHDLEVYRSSGGATTFLKVLRSNYESDSNIGFADWYFVLSKKLAEYATLDLVQKIRENREKAKFKKSVGD